MRIGTLRSNTEVVIRNRTKVLLSTAHLRNATLMDMIRFDVCTLRVLLLSLVSTSAKHLENSVQSKSVLCHQLSFPRPYKIAKDFSFDISSRNIQPIVLVIVVIRPEYIRVTCYFPPITSLYSFRRPVSITQNCLLSYQLKTSQYIRNMLLLKSMYKDTD